ncbi:hypothetical protein CPLU01_14987 [Colletotrichum plurivorum]|uniref:Uncharacterized protein n=1 Tax=Colletotrichum plurivorum TaxID=2175906 RepID=A0A8H6MXN6_9PEZI|nr:hypothetical protein CPLU01_14987 [Colletotrichum plurivorum]
MWYTIPRYLFNVSVVNLVGVLVQAGILPLMPPYYPDHSLAAQLVCIIALGMLYYCHTCPLDLRQPGGLLMAFLRDQDDLAEFTAILTCVVVVLPALNPTLMLVMFRHLPLALFVTASVAACKKIRALGGAA